MSDEILSISSKRKRGFLTSIFAIFWIILPGIDPIYVLLCPLISASSLTPPKAILIYLLPVALAIDFPSDVFPTPGGPTKHKIGPLILLVLFCTAKYSRILSLTFSKP